MSDTCARIGEGIRRDGRGELSKGVYGTKYMAGFLYTRSGDK